VSRVIALTSLSRGLPGLSVSVLRNFTGKAVLSGFITLSNSMRNGEEASEKHWELSRKRRIYMDSSQSQVSVLFSSHVLSPLGVLQRRRCLRVADNGTMEQITIEFPSQCGGLWILGSWMRPGKSDNGMDNLITCIALLVVCILGV
jgi:hypothetical protein